MRFKLPILLFLFFSFLVLPTVISAQVDSLGVATPIVISDQVEQGDIICTTDGGFKKCDSAYDPSMYGVITTSPSLYLDSPDIQGEPLALKQGDALVKVSTANGNIATGDLVTSSDQSGVAQKATLNGFALGVAMEDYTGTDVGTILVTLNVHPVGSFVGARSNLVANVRQALSAPVVAPLESLRYLLAFLIAIISFGLGFLYFGRVVKTGVEAIGRNPLASRTIQVTILVNIVITIVIVVTGLALAALILII